MDDPTSLPKIQTLIPAEVSTESTQDILKPSGNMREIPLNGGMKYDGGKPELSLIPTSLILEVGKVLTYGAKKYAPNNWRKGIQQSRLISAALRHIIAYNDGEEYDLESGLPHLAHAICELSFAMEQHLHRKQYKQFLDIRRKGQRNETI